ncbi:hypothetical protein [Planobispora longispora]|nr:hypothetical protein [Planobispora longispora]
MDVQQVRRRHEDALLAKPNVVGVATDSSGPDGGVIIVYVTRKVPPSRLAEQDAVPGRLDGFPVRVVEIGSPAAQQP